jgi:hypothetical protein
MSEEAYGHLLSFLDGEMERFWTRFNIFAAVQVGALIGLASEAQFFLCNRPVLRFALVLIISFSVVGLLSTWRGHDLQRGIVSALQDIERSFPPHAQIVAKIRSGTRLPLHFGSRVGLAFNAGAIILWLIAWLWLELSSTTIRLSPSS